MAKHDRFLGSKNVASAGTAEPLSAVGLGFVEVIIQAKKSNTGYIYLGDSSVDNTNGIQLQPEASQALEDGDLADLYIDADTNGEGVVFFYKKSKYL
jgi:hypothetical protein